MFVCSGGNEQFAEVGEEKKKKKKKKRKKRESLLDEPKPLCFGHLDHKRYRIIKKDNYTNKKKKFTVVKQSSA